MKYYLHDSNAFNDERITELYIEYGYEGLGLFYTLLEKIASQEKPIKTNVLKSQLKVGKKLEKCWQFMETLELIHSNNGETFNKQLMNFSEKYKIKKESNAKRVSEWRKNQLITDDVTHYECVCNTVKVKESEVNKSKDVNIERIKSDKMLLNKNENFLLSLSKDWKPIIERWLAFKNEKKQPYKGEIALNAMVEKLKLFSNDNPIIGMEIIDFSISNNYSSFFKPKEKIQHSMVLQKSNNPVENF